METHMVLLLLMFVLVSANGSIVSAADLTWECVLPIQSEKKTQKVVINYVNLPPSLAQKHTNSHRILIDFCRKIAYCLNKKPPKLGTQNIAVEMWTRSHLNRKWQLIVCSCDLNFVAILLLFSRSGIAVGLRLVCRWSRYCQTGGINHAERLLWSINCEQFFIQRRICRLFSRKWNSCCCFSCCYRSPFLSLSLILVICFRFFFLIYRIFFRWIWFRSSDCYMYHLIDRFHNDDFGPLTVFAFFFLRFLFCFKWHPNLNWHANWLFIQRKKN